MTSNHKECSNDITLGKLKLVKVKVNLVQIY